MEEIKKTAIKETAKDVLYFFGLLLITLAVLGIFALALATVWCAVILVVIIVLFIFYLIYSTHLEEARIQEKRRRQGV